MTNLIIHLIFLAILTFTIFLAILDFRKKRFTTKKPYISFLVPCYNCEKTLEDCINSVYRAYSKAKIEMFVINDNSTDKTAEIIEDLRQKYGFRVIRNKINLGKIKSINNTWPKAKGELIWIVDSDTILNRKSINEALRRLYSDNKVGAVSCRYSIIKEGILSWMVGLEFNMLAISHSAYNVSTALSLWGGCSVYKREALWEINGLKENMIVEDMESALRLGEKGWRVEQCFNPVLTYAPHTLKGWFKQKIRWSSGGMQCFLYHPLSFLKSPLAILFTFVYSASILANFIEIQYYPFLNVSYITSVILMTLISSPYLLLEVDKFKDLKNFLYLLGFVVIYYPIFFVVSLMGMIKGVYSYFMLRGGSRGW